MTCPRTEATTSFFRSLEIRLDTTLCGMARAFEILMTADYEDSRYTFRGMLDVSVMELITVVDQTTQLVEP